MTKFLIEGLYGIRKYIFALTENFNLFMQKYKFNEPPKRKRNKKAPKSENNFAQSSSNFINNMNLDSNKNMKKKALNSKNKLFFDDNNLIKNKYNKKIINEKLKTSNNQETNNEYYNKIKEFLSPNFDENDFDDVISKDNRTFCQYFCENFQNNQIFINTFCIFEILRPRALKFLILIMTIELYFVINALFYNEDYLSELFKSDEEDSFFAFIPRRINEYIYTSAVSGIISYLIGYFFIEEVKLKRIFVRNRNDEMKIKYELSVLAQSMRERFIGLIIFSISLSVICFIYISCFNIVYPYIRTEWIKSSTFILVLMQVINFFFTLIEACIRFLAIKCNSKKMFRLSLLFS